MSSSRSTSTDLTKALVGGGTLGAEQYGSYAPYLQSIAGTTKHPGSDILGQAGQQVQSLTGGIVQQIDTGAGKFGEGNVGIGLHSGEELVYNHLTPVQHLAVGQAVQPGTVLGSLASFSGGYYPGGYSSTPHLYLVATKDPQHWWTWGASEDPATAVASANAGTTRSTMSLLPVVLIALVAFVIVKFML